jgi:DNA-binding response OmpR family regulator/signal transduction histidine kinase
MTPPRSSRKSKSLKPETTLPEADAAGPTSSHGQKGAEVLVVDDNVVNCELMEAILEPHGFHVTQALSGEEALRKIDTSLPHLVLLDVAMPGMDGFEVARRLRAQQSTRLIPILMLTAMGDLEHRVQGLDSGADDYLTKPVDAEELLARVQSSLRLSHLRQQVDERQKLELVLGDISDGILIVDAHGRVHEASPSARRLLGLQEQFESCQIESIWGNLRGVPDSLGQALLLGRPLDFVLQRDEPALFLQVRLRSVRDAQGEVTGAVLSIRDITRESLERKLQHDVLSLVSHKFRTPLTVVSLWAKVLLDGDCGELHAEQREAMEAIQASAGELTGLLEGILNYVEQSRRLQHLRRTSLSFEQIEIELQARRSEILAPGHTLIVERREEGEVVVDTMLFMDVLTELVRNASKFAGESNRDLEVRVIMSQEAGRHVLTISDTGPGIAPEHLEKVFERFFQVEQDFTGQVKGLGLGLPMVKLALDAMGAELEVRSQLQKGTSFTIRL